MDYIDLFKQTEAELLQVQKDLLAVQQQLIETHALACRGFAIAATLAAAIRDQLDDAAVSHLQAFLSPDGLGPEMAAAAENMRSKLA